jgi:hypothetical protein
LGQPYDHDWVIRRRACRNLERAFGKCWPFREIVAS